MAWERDGPLGPREQSLHEWYWESCFFLYISASQSLPWGWWCLTHWVPEQLNTLVELKKHQGGERMWGLSSGAVPRSWDPPTLLRRVALCPDAPAAGTCFFSTPSCWCLQGLAADLLEGGLHTMNGSSKSLSPLWHQKEQLCPSHSGCGNQKPLIYEPAHKDTIHTEQAWVTSLTITSKTFSL